MVRTEDILATIRMIHEENFDVRTVTMGISLLGCRSENVERLCRYIYERILSCAGKLRDACEALTAKYGVPIVNRRIAVTPISIVAAGHGHDGFLRVAHALDEAARELEVDLIGGYTALVHKGMTPDDETLIRSIPEALSETERVCASVNAASTGAGINIDAVLLVSEMLLDLARRTANRDGFGCAKFVVFANAPEDNPFMAGAFNGIGEADCVINVGVSGPGVVKGAIERGREMSPDLTLGDIAEIIKTTAFRLTRIGELIGRELAGMVGAKFGIVDLSLAPSPKVGDSVGEILQAMGVEIIGAPGSTAALALLTDAVKKGGLFASSAVGGLSGAFIPVSEDSGLSAAVAAGDLSLEKLEAMTSVCSVGLDMIAVPGDVEAETLAALMADELAIGVINHKTTAVRIIPVPEKKAGERVVFGGLFGEATVMDIRNAGGSRQFVRHGGRIPAPLTSLHN
jgi:hypothetical protein